MICFLCFLVLYSLIACGVLSYKERELKSRHKNEDTSKAKAVHKAVSVANFCNALVATILSSAALYSMNRDQRADVYLKKPNHISQWTLESVCGYIFVEFTFIILNSFRLSDKYWKIARRAVTQLMLFHAVVLVGFTSVLIYNTGYSIALWVIWSELAVVFMGMEDFLQDSILHYRFPFLLLILRTCTTVILLSQRVVMYCVLLWLCWNQFTFQPLFLFQFLILCLGMILNALFTLERLFSWEEWFTK